jgi:hypothetical protein
MLEAASMDADVEALAGKTGGQLQGEFSSPLAKLRRCLEAESPRRRNYARDEVHHTGLRGDSCSQRLQERVDIVDVNKEYVAVL